MRLLSLLPVSLLATFALGDDSGLPPPGSPALTYTDGSFSEPNGDSSSYRQGNKMNITWTTSYETTNIYLIVGYSWAAPIQIATNSAQTWVQWDVTTDSTNSTEIYVFRGVNATGTETQKATGGFISAAFYIPVKDSSQSTSTFTSTLTLTSTSTSSSLTTSATGTGGTSVASDAATTPTPTPTPTPTSAPISGISEGAKVGVGVGVGLGVLGLGALAAALFFWRKSKKTQPLPSPQPYEMPLNGDFPSLFQAAQQQYAPHYTANQQALAGYYKPPEIGGTRGSELDAGQGHHFVPEASPDGRGPRAELQ